MLFVGTEEQLVTEVTQRPFVGITDEAAERIPQIVEAFFEEEDE